MLRFTLAAMLLAFPAQAKVHKVLTVTDADSIVIASNGMAASLRIRALGYDGPEMNSQCDAERALARRARDRLVALSAQGLRVVSELELDLYGRILGVLWTPNGREVRTILVEEGLARNYDGKTARRPWCDADGKVVP